MRHAIKEKSIGDVPISPQGIWQAQATAQYFRNLPIKAILSSPLRRARETANYIALEANLSFSEDSRLRDGLTGGICRDKHSTIL
ncbi:histidine phosphatase family protein [Paenibacillus sp. HJGM_3]|uniref:histidine phosphatase family protein n=1 Tax=Paenibacillus sp. HJGM_3 TaxID=3379816 RepID=UPI00385F9E79